MVTCNQSMQSQVVKRKHTGKIKPESQCCTKGLLFEFFCWFLVMAAFILNAKSSSSILFQSHEFNPAQMAECLLPNELWIRLIFYSFIYNSPISNCYFFIVRYKSSCYTSHIRNTCLNIETSFWNMKKCPQIAVWLLVRGHFYSGSMWDNPMADI